MSRMVLASALILSAFASPAAADPVVTYLGSLDVYPPVFYDAVAACLAGNTGQPAGSIQTSEIYLSLGVATVFDPLANGCPCNAGFTVTALHMILKNDSPQSVSANVRLALGNSDPRDAYAPETLCFAPTNGPVGSYGYGQYCVGEGMATFPVPGFYEVSFPAPLADCGCIYSSYTQSIVMWLPDRLGYSLKFVIDENPGHCPDFVADTPYWGALNWYEIPEDGNILFWADLECCEPAVANSDESWGVIKSRYR